MKQFFILFFCLFTFIADFLPAQSPAVEWQKCLGGKNGEYGWSIEPTKDGGYITAGYAEGTDDGDVMGYHGNPYVGDIWVVKIDNAGNVQWQKCLGGNSFETGASIHQTPDGGYIFAGTSASKDCNITGNHGGSDYWIVKLNSKGDIMWQKLAGGSQNEYAYSIALTNDGGYVVAGETESNDGDVTVNHGYRDYWVIKLDGSGNLQWQKSLGGTGDDEAYSLQATADGGCIIAGFTESNNGDVTGNHGKIDYWIVKLGNTGNLQWQKCLGGAGFDIAWSIQLTTDGGYIVAGMSGSDDGDVSGNHNGLGPGGSDFWIVKLNNNGNIQWQKCYGGNFNEIAYYIQNTPDGGYVVAGSAESADGDATCNAGITDMWIIKISSSGVLEWQKSLGGNYYDEAHSVQPLSDGGYIIVGSTCSPNVSGYHLHNTVNGSCGDFWVVKLSAPAAIPSNPVVKIDAASANVCAGTNATLTASVKYGGVNPTWQWMKNGINAGTNSSTYTSSGFANNDVVTCYVTSGGTCDITSIQASDAVTIKVNNNAIHPGIRISADNTFICNCTTITFKAIVLNGGASPVYQWKVNGINAGNNTNIFISNSLNSGDAITCVYSDNTSCVANGSITSNSIQINSGNSQAPSVSIAASANIICTGSPVIFTASPVNAGANPFFQWKINGANVGSDNDSLTSSSLHNGDIISCTINTDPLFPCATAGTANSNSIVAAVTDKVSPSVSITASSDTICSGSTVTFTATPVNAGTNPSFQWQINGANAGINSKSFTTTAMVNRDTVTCTINSDSLFPCVTKTITTSNKIVMVVTNQIAPSVTIISSDNNSCADKMITFNATVQNAGAFPNYSWKLNNADAGSNLAAYSTDKLQNGDKVYCVLTPDNTACSISPVSSNMITMVINDLPVITIQPADTVVKSGSEVQLRATVSDTLATYNWSPDNKLQTPLSLSPTTISITDNTIFTLSVVSSKGCAASKDAIIKIFSPVYMPNAFTPNDDGVNDIFRIPPNASLLLTEFSVYDRWGNKIFATHDIGKGWDGRYKGIKADAGVYVYMIRGTNDKGDVFLKGTVVLVR